VVVLAKTSAASVSQIITRAVAHVLHVVTVCIHLLNQLPQLNVSDVLMITVKLAALSNPLKNVLFVRILSIFLEALARLAVIKIVRLALELVLENVQHALLITTCQTVNVLLALLVSIPPLVQANAQLVVLDVLNALMLTPAPNVSQVITEVVLVLPVMPAYSLNLDQLP